MKLTRSIGDCNASAAFVVHTVALSSRRDGEAIKYADAVRTQRDTIAQGAMDSVKWVEGKPRMGKTVFG